MDSNFQRTIHNTKIVFLPYATDLNLLPTPKIHVFELIKGIERASPEALTSALLEELKRRKGSEIVLILPDLQRRVGNFLPSDIIRALDSTFDNDFFMRCGLQKLTIVCGNPQLLFGQLRVLQRAVQHNSALHAPPLHGNSIPLLRVPQGGAYLLEGVYIRPASREDVLSLKLHNAETFRFDKTITSIPELRALIRAKIVERFQDLQDQITLIIEDFVAHDTIPVEALIDLTLEAIAELGRTRHKLEAVFLIYSDEKIADIIRNHLYAKSTSPPVRDIVSPPRPESHGKPKTAKKRSALKIDLFVGDVREVILAAGADGVVNAANQRLQHGGGIAGRLASVFPDLQGVSNRFMATISSGELAVGSAHFTAAGGTLGSIKGVVHAVSPDFRSSTTNRNADLALLQLAAENTLVVASMHGMLHVVEPLLSGAIFRGDLALDTIAEQVVAGLGSAVRRGISVAQVTFVALNDDDTMKAIKSAVKAYQLRFPDVPLIFDENVHQVPPLQSVQPVAAPLPMAPGAPRRDETPGESASSGRDALARVEQMNIEDKNPHVRRKRPDEKLVLIRAESGRSRLPSALVFLMLVDDEGNPMGEEADVVLGGYDRRDIQARWSEQVALGSYDYGRGKFVVSVFSSGDEPLKIVVMMRPMAYGDDETEWTSSLGLLVSAALHHVRAALLSDNVETQQFNIFMALPRAPLAAGLQKLLQHSMLLTLFSFRENNPNSFESIVVWDADDQDGRDLEGECRTLQYRFDSGEAAKADGSLPRDDVSEMSLCSYAGGELSVSYSHSVAMDDWVQVTDIATRLAYPLEYLRGAPNTETPVAILIGITPQGIPEPGVSNDLVTDLRLVSSFCHMVLTMAQNHITLTEKEFVYIPVDANPHVQSAIAVVIPPFPSDFDKGSPQRKTDLLNQLIQSEISFLNAAWEHGVVHLVSTFAGAYTFGWPTQLLAYAKIRAVEEVLGRLRVLNDDRPLPETIRYAGSYLYLVNELSRLITMYRDADAETAAVPQDDPMLVDAEENRRAHQHAQQALEQAAQRDGPHSAAQFALLRLKKRKKKSDVICRLEAMRQRKKHKKE